VAAASHPSQELDEVEVKTATLAEQSRPDPSSRCHDQRIGIHLPRLDSLLAAGLNGRCDLTLAAIPCHGHLDGFAHLMIIEPGQESRNALYRLAVNRDDDVPRDDTPIASNMNAAEASRSRGSSWRDLQHDHTHHP
jgi:hypothetical protein